MDQQISTFSKKKFKNEILFAQDEYAINQKKFRGFEVRMTNSNFGEVSSKFSQNRHTLVVMSKIHLL